ncbi:MAG: hypothetical protein AAF617_16875 [Bacteroidota bacterium]
MKKIFLKSRHLVVAFSLLVASLCIIGCQAEDVTTDAEESAKDTEIITSKSIPGIPIDPDFGPPPMPSPQVFDEHCIVRLAYLSYLERCPENAAVVGYWINIFRAQGFTGVAVGFISSPEARQRWNHRYNAFLHRNNITSQDIDIKVYIAYRGLAQREPDVNGGIFWTNILRTQGLAAVANGIANGPRFQNRLRNIRTECNNADNRCVF